MNNSRRLKRTYPSAGLRANCSFRGRKRIWFWNLRLAVQENWYSHSDHQHSALNDSFLGAFAELRKATISFVMFLCLSVLPFVRMEDLVSHWTDFYEILYLSIFRKSVKEILTSFKIDTFNRYSTWDVCILIILSPWILLRMRSISVTSCPKIVPFMR